MWGKKIILKFLENILYKWLEKMYIIDKYKYCSCFVDNDEDFVSFLEYLEIEENLRMGYLI